MAKQSRQAARLRPLVDPEEPQLFYDENDRLCANVYVEQQRSHRAPWVVGMITSLILGIAVGADGVKIYERNEKTWNQGHTADVSPLPSVAESSPSQQAVVQPIATPKVTTAPSATVSRSPLPTPSSSAAANERFEIAQTMIVGFDAKTPKATIDKVAADTHIGGIYLTDTKNAVADGFTPAYFQHLSELAGAPMLVAGDEEGGQIHRESYNFDFPSAKAMGQMSTSQVEAVGVQAGQQMLADGVRLDLAPVLDVDDGRHDGAITQYDRSFGGSAANIASKAGALEAGLEQAGVTGVFKHFPGIGRATPDSDTDSHKAVSPSLTSLEQLDLQPYQTLIGQGVAKVVMMSNEYVTGLDAANPASISPSAVNLLRSQLHFNGLITTDSLTALDGYDGKTLSGNIVSAVEAGVDAPLFSYKSEASIETAITKIAVAVPAAQIDQSYNKLAAFKPN